MGTQSHSHEKTKVTFDCSIEEKTYIKMLAAKAHMTLGEFVLSYLRSDFPKPEKRKPNKETLAAMKETREGKGTVYNSMDDFWNEMGVKPSAQS
ncbi:MAG: hypothetical protein H0W88_06780 [Parachlamydiaceae bacterium]|nr:hypothetical protein [Parachlamydiaceae bacterium]